MCIRDSNQPLVSCFVPEIAVNNRACEVLAGLAFGLESGTDFTAGVSGMSLLLLAFQERGKADAGLGGRHRNACQFTESGQQVDSGLGQ